MPSSISAGLILDIARGRHVAFQTLTVGDGQLLQALDQRQRALLLLHGGAIEGLVSETIELAAVVNGILVGLAADGVTPVYLTTFQDGWPIHLNGNGVPYVDFSEPKIAGDPFGQFGGTPGFPLPADFLKLIAVTYARADSTVLPIDVIRETARLERRRENVPTVFVSGNRLVPVRPLNTGNTNDVWASGIVTIQLSYVALPVLRTLADVLTLPAALHEALIAGMAEFMAFNAQLGSTGITQGDRAAFTSAARRAEASAEDYGVDIVGTATSDHIAFRG